MYKTLRLFFFFANREKKKCYSHAEKIKHLLACVAGAFVRAHIQASKLPAPFSLTPRKTPAKAGFPRSGTRGKYSYSTWNIFKSRVKNQKTLKQASQVHEHCNVFQISI